MDPLALSAIHGALSTTGPDLAQLSHALWSNPELGMQEFAAHDALTTFLEQHGFVVERHAVLPTGFVASHTSGAASRPHVVLLAEFDALPDIGHACGHNLIATTAVGAAVALRAAMEATGVCGRVSVFGTPAEESHGGKLHFITSGRFKEVDAALMVHPVGGSTNVLLPATTANKDLGITFFGKASHAAANPWEGINAMDAAVLAYQNVAARRQQFRPGWRAAGIITHGGTVSNIIPERTELQFTLRAPTRAELSELFEAFNNCIHAAATATGCTVQCVERMDGYFDVRHNTALANAFANNATSCGVPLDKACSFGGSTDMGNVSYEVPSIHPVFHIGSTAQIHERDFTKDTGTAAAHEFAMQQAQLLAMTAMDVLGSSQLRDAMWKEFREGEGKSL